MTSKPAPRNPSITKDYRRLRFGTLTGKGLAWSIALPACWIVLYYAFVAHVRISMGRWPHFGEGLAASPLVFHHGAVLALMGAMVVSLCAVPLMVLASLVESRWRPIAVYAVCYAGAVGVAWGALFLAPPAFLNWLFD